MKKKLPPGFYPAFDINHKIFNPEQIKQLNFVELAGGVKELGKLIKQSNFQKVYLIIVNQIH